MIFQQEKVCSLHKKTPSLVFVATMVLPGMASGFQAGEDWYGMLGFYLGAGDEEDDFLRFFEISNQKSLKPTKNKGGSALKWEGEAAEKL